MSKKTRLKIGEFSQLMQVTVKTLRHYEQKGLLLPDEVDEWTGYRYYSIDQMQKLLAYPKHPATDRENQGNGSAAEAADNPPQPTARLEEHSQRDEDNGKIQHSVTARNHRGKSS